jgi:type I restriction-modification system DNA methylase subunit
MTFFLKSDVMSSNQSGVGEIRKNIIEADLVDRAMEAVERDNPSLKGVLPKDYARPELDKQRLGQLIDLDLQHPP